MLRKVVEEERAFCECFLLNKQDKGYFIQTHTIHVHSRDASIKILKLPIKIANGQNIDTNNNNNVIKTPIGSAKNKGNNASDIAIAHQQSQGFVLALSSANRSLLLFLILIFYFLFSRSEDEAHAKSVGQNSKSNNNDNLLYSDKKQSEITAVATEPSAHSEIKNDNSAILTNLDSDNNSKACNTTSLSTPTPVPISATTTSMPTAIPSSSLISMTQHNGSSAVENGISTFDHSYADIGSGKLNTSTKDSSMNCSNLDFLPAMEKSMTSLPPPPQPPKVFSSQHHNIGQQQQQHVPIVPIHVPVNFSFSFIINF